MGQGPGLPAACATCWGRGMLLPPLPPLLLTPPLSSVNPLTPPHPVLSYTKYLLEALKRRELFQWLEMVPVRWWHALLYRDQYNYGGVEAVVPADLEGGF